MIDQLNVQYKGQFCQYGNDGNHIKTLGDPSIFVNNLTYFCPLISCSQSL